MMREWWKRVRRLIASLSAGFCIALTSGASMAGESAAVGAIAVTSSNDMFEITAIVEGRSQTPVDVTANLSVTKTDTSGSVETRQSKRVQVNESNRIEVARTSVSMGLDGRLEVSLIIEDNGDVIDHLTHTVVRNHQK